MNVNDFDWKILEEAYAGDKVTRQAVLTNHGIIQGVHRADLAHFKAADGTMQYRGTTWVIITDPDTGQPEWAPEPPKIMTSADEARAWLDAWLDMSYAAATDW